MTTEKIQYVCPQCRSSISEDNGLYQCLECNSIWWIEHGIPRFAKSEVKWSVFDDDVAEKVTAMAERTTWREAVDAHADTIGDYTLRYIEDESRADWHVILPLGPQAAVLDIGSGWGNIALSLAKRCGQLFCADVNMLNLRLLRARFRDCGVDNVSIFQYEPNEFLRLPFPDSTFDVVLLNGVLEWMGVAEINASPKAIQLAALREIRRLLKPAGALYIGIKNRYSKSTLCGQRIHGELPFVGLFPRPISNLVTKLVRGKPHRTYIYSYGGYRRLLQSAGFNKLDFYIPYPSYHHPHYLIPLNPPWIKRFWLDRLFVSRSKKYQIFQQLRLSKLPFHWLAYSYSIRCTK